MVIECKVAYEDAFSTEREYIKKYAGRCLLNRMCNKQRMLDIRWKAYLDRKKAPA